MTSFESLIANLLVFGALFLLWAAIYTHYLRKNKLIATTVGL